MKFRLLRPALSGAVATCSGNGLARFAYVPLFPAMVASGWVDGGQAGALGGAALLGYLIGTLAGRPAGLRIGVGGTLDAGMTLIAVSLAACAWNGGFWWLMAWRTIAGVGGGFVMALAGPASQASVPLHLRGVAGGLVLAGIGAGIAAGAVLVPAVVPFGVSATWLTLSTVVFGLWLFARQAWPDMPLDRPPPGGGGGAAILLVVTYGLHSAGMVPPMVYLADLAARGRGMGVTAGALAWLVFGVVGIIGGLVSGRVIDRIGGRPTLVLWLGCQVVALALALPSTGWLIWPAAAAAGFAAVGVSTITLTVAREMAPLHAVQVWVRATAAFGVVQTIVAFGLAWLFAATGESHLAVFATGLGFSVAAVLAALWLAR